MTGASGASLDNSLRFEMTGASGASGMSTLERV